MLFAQRRKWQRRWLGRDCETRKFERLGRLGRSEGREHGRALLVVPQGSQKWRAGRCTLEREHRAAQRSDEAGEGDDDGTISRGRCDKADVIPEGLRRHRQRARCGLGQKQDRFVRCEDLQ